MAKEKRDWGRIAELALLFLATIAAAYSAYQSREAAEKSNAQNASEVLFLSRLDAQKRYIEAYGELDTALHQIAAETASTTVDLEEPSVLERLSIEQAARVAEVARQSISAFGRYQHSLNAARGVWPDQLEEEIVHAYEDALVASTCYRIAGSPPMTNDELIIRRRQLLDACRSLPAKNTDFRSASNSVVNSMVSATRAAMNDVGASRSNAVGAPEDEHE